MKHTWRILSALLFLALQIVAAAPASAQSATPTPVPGYEWVPIASIAWNEFYRGDPCCGLPTWPANWQDPFTGAGMAELYGGTAAVLVWSARQTIFGIWADVARPTGDAYLDLDLIDSGIYTGRGYTFDSVSDSPIVFLGDPVTFDETSFQVINAHPLNVYGIWVLVAGATPTPTAQPTATTYPIIGACIPQEAVSIATPTAAVRTPTPFGTRTPSPTSTPGPTSTPAAPPSGFSNIATFELGTSPWSSNGLAAWSSGAGPDTLAGIGILPFTAGATVNTIGAPIPLGAVPPNAMIFESANLPRPWRIAADVRTAAPVTAGTYPYLQVFEWRDGGAGTGSWYLVANQRIGESWHTITASSSVSVTVRAVALRAVLGLTAITNPLGFIPQDAANSVQIDNLRLGAGQNYANNPSVMQLPVCAAGAGGATNTKICTITTRAVDVFGKCSKPSSLLEIGGWIKYLWCSVSTYFMFLSQNQQQISDMQTRQAKLEPSGTLLEVPDSVSIAQGTLNYYRARFSGTTAQNMDWAGLWNFDWSNPLPYVPPPDFTAEPVSGSCDLGDGINFSAQDRMVACTALEFVRSTPFVPVVQFLINLGGVVMVLMYIGNKWMVSNASA